MKLRVFLQASVLLFYNNDCANGLSIKPPSEEIFSTQLCPDPTTRTFSIQHSSLSGSILTVPKDILSVNLDKPKEPIHFYESCTFRVKSGRNKDKNGSDALISNVKVRSVNLNVNPWNFSKAENCTNFIKFNNWDERDGGRYPVLCGRENFDQYLGPYGHPMVLYYQWKNGGLSFPLFHSSYGPHHRDRKETLDLNYMQIYFDIQFNKGHHKCRVQQYRLDTLRQGCSLIDYDDEPVCGEYDCSELESLYQAKMTLFRNGETDNDTVLVWKSKQDKYRMRTFLRQKFVPVVFLVVLIFAYRSYMKAGMRFRNSIEDDIPDFRTRSLRLRRHFPSSRAYSNREAPADPFWDFDTDDDPPPYGTDGVSRIRPASSVTNSIPQQQQQQNSRAIPTVQCKPDPPPSYESVCPPTYFEATKP